jgi:hypothetical protein
MGPRVGVGAVEKTKIFHCRESNLGRAARLRDTDSPFLIITKNTNF